MVIFRFNSHQYTNNQRLNKTNLLLLPLPPQNFINIMGEILKQGDVFHIPDKVFVSIGDYCIESGRVYAFPEDRSHVRARLKDSLINLLHENEVKFESDIIDRFVNYIAKDVPADTCRLPTGDFVVASIKHFTDNEDHVFCHRVGDPSDRMHFTQNRTYGHYRFEAIQ